VCVFLCVCVGIYIGMCCAPPGFNPGTQFGYDNKEAGVNVLLYKLTGGMCMCVCVFLCVCVRERERKR
jgi:hypothetical protein